MMGYSLLAALMPGGVLGKVQVVDGWSILIEKGGGTEEVFSNAENFLEEGKAPNVKIGRGRIAPGLIRGILGVQKGVLHGQGKRWEAWPLSKYSSGLEIWRIP